MSSKTKPAIKTSVELPIKNDDSPFLILTHQGDGRYEKTGQIPANLSVDELSSLGGPQTTIKAIRALCIECSGDSMSEARKCTAFRCPLWPFRMGTNPFHGNRGDK